jgi:hypothetical protein
MNWTTQATKGNKTPCIVVEVDLDYIEDEAVTATNPDDGDSLCYRTPATTEQGEFVVTTKTRRWMTNTQRAMPELDAIPCLKAMKLQPEEVKIGKGLGYFGQVTVDLVDFVDDDRREDPFYDDSSRDGVNHSAGTYFAKLMARNPWWTGRKLRVIEGWTTDGVWQAADAITHHFLIRDVQGPSNGGFRITAAGPLQLLNLDEVECPAASEGVLQEDINAIATSAEIHDATIAEGYPASGFVRINDEVMSFARSGVHLTITRAQEGTTSEGHSALDTIQLCRNWVDTPVADIIEDMLTEDGQVDPSYLDTAQWAEEATIWLSLYRFTAMITKPTKILELVGELLEISAAIAWWDDQDGKVKMRAIRPGLTARGTWTDRFSFLKPVDFNRDMSQRISRMDVLIDLRSADLDPKEAKSYKIRVVGSPQGEGVNENLTEKVHLVASRWLKSTQIALARRASVQVVTQLRDGRKTVTAEVGAKDAIADIGDIIDVKTRELVDRTGQPAVTRCMVTKRDPIQVGVKYRYQMEVFGFDGRYAFMTAADCPDYDVASAAGRDPGGFMCNADGSGFGPLDPPYLMG